MKTSPFWTATPGRLPVYCSVTCQPETSVNRTFGVTWTGAPGTVGPVGPVGPVPGRAPGTGMIALSNWVPSTIAMSTPATMSVGRQPVEIQPGEQCARRGGERLDRLAGDVAGIGTCGHHRGLHAGAGRRGGPRLHRRCGRRRRGGRVDARDAR